MVRTVILEKEVGMGTNRWISTEADIVLRIEIPNWANVMVGHDIGIPVSILAV